MHLLNSAIEAELDADYRMAIKYYLPLSRQGSLLDRVGIYQAIARCFEKLGSFGKAALWHERAGRGYMKLPAALMGRQERAYYAMGEFRAAIQDHTPHLSKHNAVRSYLKALAICLEQGKEGYSHEMLFAAHLCAKTHAYGRAARFFTDTALQFQKERQEAMARESYRLAAQYCEKAGEVKLARKLRAAAGTLG